MNNKDKLLSFLKNQKVLVLATQGETPWATNVYYGIANDFRFYFVSSIETEHSKHILQSPKVAFSVVWFNEQNHYDRKGVQGRGLCRIAETEEEISTGIHLHNERFPEFKQNLTVGYIKSEENDSKVWVIEPTHIKFWNDELYGEEETEEFDF